MMCARESSEGHIRVHHRHERRLPRTPTSTSNTWMMKGSEKGSEGSEGSTSCSNDVDARPMWDSQLSLSDLTPPRVHFHEFFQQHSAGSTATDGSQTLRGPCFLPRKSLHVTLRRPYPRGRQVERSRGPEVKRSRDPEIGGDRRQQLRAEPQLTSTAEYFPSV